MSGDVAARLVAEGLQPSAWANGPGERYSAHEHAYDKVIAVQRGSIAFGLPMTGETFDLAAGDRLELPAGTLHDALVGAGGVSCLEAHVAVRSLAKVSHRVAGTW